MAELDQVPPEFLVLAEARVETISAESLRYASLAVQERQLPLRQPA